MDTDGSIRTTGRLPSDSHRPRPAARSCGRRAARRAVGTLGVASLMLLWTDASGGPVTLEPCSVLSLDEASAVLKGPTKREVPSPIKYKGISTGGTCVYRLEKAPMTTITVRVDATPTGAQRQRFEAGLRRPPAAEFSGVGDRAYTEIRPKGPQSVTFLRGDTLATVTVDGLSIYEAKRVAALVAPRLPVSIDGPSSSTPSPSAAVARGSGKLDPALVGSWFLKQKDGRGVANLRVERDGRFYMTLLAGNKQQQGTMDADNGLLHLYPERGGRDQELRYRIVDKNEMEWVDRQGNVTIVRRQFR